MRQGIRGGDMTLEDEVSAALGTGGFIGPTDESLQRHLRDFLGSAAADVIPVGVAYPRTTAEVSAVLRICSAYGQPIVVQGGLTGLTAATRPFNGELILSLERMRDIEEIDPVAATMTLQAGVPLQFAQENAAAAGMSFPIDMGSRGSCLIGGSIATNAGGNRVLRYGMTRDSVLGVEAVLADGTVVNALNKMLKNNTGYDLKQLFIGSEGTLGVVTRAVFRLYPAPVSAYAALCRVTDYDAVTALLRDARRTLGSTLSAFEVMWPDYYAYATGSAGRRTPLALEKGLYVLLDTLGTSVDADRQRFEAWLTNASETGLVQDAVMAQSSREFDELWAVREAVSELRAVFGDFVAFDVSVPVGDIGRFVEDCKCRIHEQLPDALLLTFGHVADSNVHFAYASPRGPLNEQLVDDIIYETVRDWRGSVSAEHGIGLAKKAYLGYSRSEPELALMRQLKQLLDPKSLLNPGRVL